ncbi:MAG: GNAT family N-acetyltransferase [Candidatus Bipolaricaulota bacterium]|nr:GNAT family N-acetyltransferase [Candidatus Bipolaricaulota bacterium]
MHMIRTLEELSMNAWPALETSVSDGWVLRFSEGYTRRANSVHPLEPGVHGLADKIDEAERLYDERRLPPTFKMTSACEPSGLDLALAERGYEWAAGTSVRVATLAPTAFAPVRVDLSWDRAREWREAFHRMSDVAPERRTIHDRMLSRIAAPAGFASLDQDGRVVACALGVVEEGWLGVFDVVVDGAERRKGRGERLMRGLMDWGRELGAERVYLQVMLHNAPAVALYQKLGFREAYRYWYRVRSLSH